MKRFFSALIIACLWLSSLNTVQAADSWETMGKVSFKLKYDKELGYDLEIPVFSADVLELEGSTVYLSGYMIPMNGVNKQNYFVISKFPVAQCFFCGGAGPETVAEVYCKKAIPYTTKIVSIKGRLELNFSDPNQLIYIIRDAELNM